MTLIEWKDEFRVGIASVDHEQRERVELINQLHRSIEAGCERDAIIVELGEVYAHIAAHFALEEKSMRDASYPAYPEHKADHEALLDQLRDIMDRVEDGEQDTDKWLPAELGDWFQVHFSTHDARLHRRD